MAKLFGRYVEIRAGVPGQPGRAWKSTKAGGLRVAFDITKTARRGSNKGTIKIWNLNNDSIGELEQVGVVVQVLAGYEDNFSLLFTGDIAKQGVKTTNEGVDKITTIEAGNAELALRKTRSDFSVSAGSTSLDVLEKIVGAMGIGPGNIKNLDHKEYLTGFVHSGLARDVLDEVASDVGALWSIQNGALQFLKPGDTTDDTAVLLTPETGLIGAPVRTKNGIEGAALMDPEIFPGRLIKIKSKTIDAFFKIRETQYSGDIRGGDWLVNFKGKKVAA